MLNKPIDREIDKRENLISGTNLMYIIILNDIHL